MARKLVVPGDIVYRLEKEPGQSYSRWTFRHGFVFAVKYPREDHWGCEDRLSVLWNDMRVSLECDCSVQTQGEFFIHTK